ncbi:MAG TPA: hypothetical protein VGM90_25700 [Kofleriaceae bacterium]|jgi:hypothetical protein
MRILAIVLLVSACQADPVGRLCDLGSAAPGPNELTIATPSLDCVSRTCLRTPVERELPPGSVPPTGNTGLCTAACGSDDDCEGVTETPCRTGFVCQIATTVGPFACEKLCVCRDYVNTPRPDDAACPAP